MHAWPALVRWDRGLLREAARIETGPRRASSHPDSIAASFGRLRGLKQMSAQSVRPEGHRGLLREAARIETRPGRPLWAALLIAASFGRLRGLKRTDYP